MKQMEDHIREKLSGEAQATALAFAAYLREHQIIFHRDEGPYWKDKCYFWLMSGEKCVGFIALADSAEQHQWTVWSNDDPAYETDSVEEGIKQVAWQQIDRCVHCGSCAGGKTKVVFGQVFEQVCGCTFRLDDPGMNELPFMKKMIELCL